MKKVLISIMVILILITLSACSKNEKTINSNVHEIENSKLKEETNLEGLKFSNETITFDGENTEFVSTVKNTTDKAQELTWIKAVVKYEDTNKLERDVELLIYFGEKIPAGEVRTTKTVVDADLRKVIDVKYEIVR